MSSTTTTNWTCDACGVEEKTAPNEQPRGWARIAVSKPPKANPLEVDRDEMEVCRNCALDWRMRMRVSRARDRAS